MKVNDLSLKETIKSHKTIPHLCVKSFYFVDGHKGIDTVPRRSPDLLA